MSQTPPSGPSPSGSPTGSTPSAGPPSAGPPRRPDRPYGTDYGTRPPGGRGGAGEPGGAGGAPAGVAPPPGAGRPAGWRPVPPAAHRRRSATAPLGWLLLVPVAVCWLGGLAGPTVHTFWLSLHAGPPFVGTSRFVGLGNYPDLLGTRGLSSAIGFTAAIVAVRVVAVGVLPALIAWGTAYLGRRVAIPLAVVFAVPLVVATPVVAAARAVLGGARTALGTPTGARLTLLDLNATHALVYGCALGAVVLLGALRSDPTRPSSGLFTRGFVTAWAVGVVAAAAYGIQSLTEVYLVTGGGPRDATTTLGVLVLKLSVVTLQVGPGAALGVLMLVPVLLLGLLAGWLLVSGRISFDLSVRPHRWPTARPPAAPIVAGALALVVALVVWFRAVVPVVAGWGGGADLPSLGGVVAHAALHDLPTTVLVVAIAAVAAAGVVLARPLGPYSEWALLPLAPWLFATNVPVADSLITSYTRGGPLWPFAHLQPALSFLPLLTFAFALLLRGAEPRWRAAQARQERSAFSRHVLLRLVPGAAGLLLGALVASTHEFVTPYLTVVRSGDTPLARTIATRLGQYGYGGGGQHGITALDLPLAIPGVIVLGLLFAWYAVRLVVRADVPAVRPPDLAPAGPLTAPAPTTSTAPPAGPPGSPPERPRPRG